MSYRLGLIGYPITHSLSPWIHEQFLNRTNLQGTYSLYEIDPTSNFTVEMERLKEKQLHGFNVTVPYKVKIIDYLDEIDEQAEHIGAVNTVLCKNGKWTGYNTDGIGYVRSLIGKYPFIETMKTAKILLLGAGGAAQGIYYALLESGYEDIAIANRSVQKAIEIVGTNKNLVLTLEEAEHSLANYDIIIQTTSVGMKPNANEKIISLQNINKNAIVSDIVYQPLLTSFLQQAQSLQRSIHFGHTMLLYQAQYAFEIWTNEQPQMDHLDDELQRVLEE